MEKGGINVKSKQSFVLPENYSLDRQITYKGVVYQIVEILRSDMLLVVNKEEFDNKQFPLQTYIIPGE